MFREIKGDRGLELKFSRENCLKLRGGQTILR